MEAALEVVEEAAVPEDLRQVAFGKAFDALAGKHNGQVDDDGQSPVSPASGSPLAEAAAKFGVDPDLVERVLEVDADGVHLMIPRSRFDKKKSQAILEVAMLVVGVRQAAGLEEWTSLALVRQATEELGVDDPSNFASHIRKMSGVRAQGSGKSGELKMNSVGFEATATLIKRLGGEA
jgi:hypothetical protein